MEAGRIGEGKEKPFLRRQQGGRSWRLPLVGEAVVRFAVPRKSIDTASFLMEAATARSGLLAALTCRKARILKLQWLVREVVLGIEVLIDLPRDSRSHRTAHGTSARQQ